MYTYPVRPNEIYHYGIKRKSGRYPWGSGKRPFQDLEMQLRRQISDNKDNRIKINTEIAKNKNISESNNARAYYLIKQYDNNQKVAKLLSDYSKMASEFNFKMDPTTYNEGLKFYRELVETKRMSNLVETQNILKTIIERMEDKT